MKCVCFRSCLFFLEDNSEARPCFQPFFNMPEDPQLGDTLKGKGEGTLGGGFAGGRTACRATRVGLGLSLATVWQQDLGRFPPCGHGGNFAVALGDKVWRCLCMGLQHRLQLHLATLEILLG